MKERIYIQKKYTHYFETWLDEKDTKTVLNYMEENHLRECDMDIAVEECLDQGLIDIQPWDWDDVYGAELEEITYVGLEEVEQ